LNGTLSADLTPNTYGPKIKIALTNVSLQSDGIHWNGQIEVDIVGQDDAGNTYDPISQTLALNPRKEIYDRMLHDGPPFTQSLHIDPKASSLRVIAPDLNGDNLGTVLSGRDKSRSSADGLRARKECAAPRRAIRIPCASPRTAYTLL
jgi:hypothetical protein